jgi:DNA-nicking Smr family endonuclease
MAPGGCTLFWWMMAKKKDPNDLDDSSLLEHAFRGVAPLPGRKIGETPAPPAAKQPKRKVSRPATLPQVTVPLAKPAMPEIKHGDAPGVDKSTARRLKRGQLPIEARLDLHGHRQDEAHRALEAFIAGQASAGRRCVLVITGKGAVSQGGGVLREMVPRWLNQSPNRERIISFTHATPADGGAGALYVLLKRRRS